MDNKSVLYYLSVIPSQGLPEDPGVVLGRDTKRSVWIFERTEKIGGREGGKQCVRFTGVYSSHLFLCTTITKSRPCSHEGPLLYRGVSQRSVRRVGIKSDGSRLRTKFTELLKTRPYYGGVYSQLPGRSA